MKSSFALNTGIAAVVLTLLAGCGQTGPLYMPKPPAKPAAPPAPHTPSATAPAAQSPINTPS